MNNNTNKTPCAKVKVRVKRANENSRASAQPSVVTDALELLDTALEVSEEKIVEENNVVEPDIVQEVIECTVNNNAAEAENNAVVFVSIEESTVIKETIIEDEPESNKTANNEPESAEHEKKAARSRRKVFSRFSEMSLLRKVLTVLCIIFCLWSLLPIIPGIIGIGLFAPLAIGLFALFTVTAWDFISSVRSRWWKALWLFIGLVAMTGIVAFAFVSGLMISAAGNTAPVNNSNVTVVVLGCKVNGTQPSRMLQGRLDTAAEYLLTHPGTNCIVTGGMGDDENLPEAIVMKQYLVEKGVSASRIKIEDKSTNTKENIENAIEVANANNYYTTFYIVTDEFHQLRAGMICDELGITSYALACDTPWYLTMNYWFREMFALAYHSVTKN